MGRYINQEAVIVRLQGKVKVTDNPEQNPDRMSVTLLNRLINEAESQVEMDLSTRYTAPFQTIEGLPFSRLPERPTMEVLRTLCELLSVVRVLETDFGKGSAVSGSKYCEDCQKRYDRIVFGDDERKVPGLITLRVNSYNTFRQPPLPGLQSNYQVSKVDTGFAGQVLRHDDHGYGSNPIHQINSPEENYWNGFVGSEHEDREDHFE